MRHDTPKPVAELLARYAPLLVKSVLDPSAGSGILIEPFARRRSECTIECIDSDRRAVAKLRDRFRDYRKVKVHASDFLKWSNLRSGQHQKRFDCIVMNPPFSAR